MSTNAVMDLLQDSFQARTRGKKVALLYPWSSIRNLFLAQYLRAEPAGLVYFRLEGDNPKLKSWLGQLADELERLADGFAGNLRQAIKAGKPEEMAAALGADLASYKGAGSLILFIDEFDRAKMNAELKSFVERLVADLPANTQLAISGRNLTLDPWYPLVASGQACVLGTETRQDDILYAIEDKPRPRLEVYAFGQGHVLVNGEEMSRWDGNLSRNLFFFLLDHPLITRDEIFAVFWPRLSVKEATNVFHVTKRKINENLNMKMEGRRSADLTQYHSGFYVPGEKVLRRYDVEEFQTAVEQSMLATSDAQEKVLLTRAVELYTRPFLTTVTMKWSNERREQLQQTYAQALISMARLYLRNHDWRSALGYFGRAIKVAPQREDLHREVMNIYLQQSLYDDAARQYRALEKIVNETLQIEPARESRELFAAVQARI